MDGVLVNNTRAHVRAFEIFCKRYGVEEWQRKLQTSFGMGNDDIMRQILPEEIIREKGLKALGEEKEAIYREVYAPEIRPVRGLVDLLEEPTSFLDLPNRYELCTLLRRLAHDHRKCILFSTHELDIALSLCDSIALIDPPVLRYLPTPDMACSGYIERLFSNSFVTFDTESGTIKVRK